MRPATARRSSVRSRKPPNREEAARQRKTSEQNEYDELLPQAVDVIFETGQASVSMLQRRLKLGYSRAARLVDQMEERGIVGPFEALNAPDAHYKSAVA